MKNFGRIGSLALALGVAGLLAGCASYRNNVTQRTRFSNDFEVVETSTKRTLNPQEMAVLRAKVADYLEREGATANGNYYVKVFLGPDKDGTSADWVIVRFSRDSDLRFQLLGSDDNYYAGYRSYASYDYYPYGYDNFSRISFQYYDDPYYYGSRYYFPPQRRDNHDRNRDRDRDHDGDRDHDHDRNHDGDRNRHDDNSPGQDPRRFKPSAPAPTPQATRTRWDNDSSGQNNSPRENNYPRHGGASARSQPDHSNDSTYSPPIRTSSQSAPRTESSSNGAARSDSFRTSSQSAPSYSPPPARSESGPRTSSSQSQPDKYQPGALRE